MSEDIESYSGKRWWTVFYVNANRFLGVAIVQGSSADDAVAECARRGIEPPRAAAGAEIMRPESVPPEEFRNRLLNGEEWANSIHAPRG